MADALQAAQAEIERTKRELETKALHKYFTRLGIAGSAYAVECKECRKSKTTPPAQLDPAIWPYNGKVHNDETSSTI